MLTSAVAAAHLLAEDLGAGARVLACRGPAAWCRRSRRPASSSFVSRRPRPSWSAGTATSTSPVSTSASARYTNGARFVATNLDATYPVPGGLVPGAGAIVAAVATASGHSPEVAGKPFPPTAALVHRRFGRHGVMVGDRPSTDGAMADALGWPFALVLSGVASATPAGGGEPIPSPPPPFVADDLDVLAPRLVAALGAARGAGAPGA